MRVCFQTGPQVETETANEFATGANIPFLETSAKNATNVEDAFMKVRGRTHAHSSMYAHTETAQTEERQRMRERQRD